MATRLGHIARRSICVAGSLLATAGCATVARSTSESEPYHLLVNNRSESEVVVYLMPASGALGARLGEASSFGSTILRVPKNALSAGNVLALRLHQIGQPNVRDWVSPTVILGEDIVAKLDIRSDGLGNMGMSSLYTEQGSYAIPLALRRGH